MPIGSGEKFTSSFGFILPEDSDSSVTLLYKASFEDPDSFEFKPGSQFRQAARKF